MLSIQNIFFYLTYVLTQKLIESKNFSLTLDYNLFCFSNNDELNEEEKSMFIQYSYLYVNNLIYFHLNTFKKRSLTDLIECKNFTSINCECMAKCWVFANKLMQNYDINGYLAKIQQVKKHKLS